MKISFLLLLNLFLLCCFSVVLSKSYDSVWSWGLKRFTHHKNIYKKGETRVSSLKSASVYCFGRACGLKENVLDWTEASAVGTFNNTLLTVGWGILDIHAGHSNTVGMTNDDVMFAAGYLEGYLTAQHIQNQYINVFRATFPEPVDKQLLRKMKSWFQSQRAWADAMISLNSNDPFWIHTGYVLAQLDGLYNGYKSAMRDRGQTPEDKFIVDFLNADGDLIDLKNVLEPKYRPKWRSFTKEQAIDYFYGTGHCSVLIKPLAGFENVYMSHSSWYDLRASNRIFKHYNFDVKDQHTAAKRVSFSSYPGYLNSLDDFYQLGSGMMMLQTTNSIFNESLYDLVNWRSLLAWQRVRVANMMADSGKKWTEIVARHNSGTYNNQYMVVDLKLVQEKTSFPANTLWVAEQIPGLVVADDLTSILSSGYFSSYNIPFFPEIYNRSGYPDYVARFGNEYSYQLAPRAKMFRRDQANVVDMKTMKDIMRYNDYKHDPYSDGDPRKAICSRSDLNPSSLATSGCYDTKISDLKMARKYESLIINGPTTSHGLPPFSWTGRYSSISHVGLPLVYDFPWIRTQPTLNPDLKH